MNLPSSVGSVQAELGEGPFWHDGALYWTDILGKKIYRHFPSSGITEERSLPEYVGAFAPRKGGGFILAMKNGFSFLSDFTGELTPITDPESDKPNNRFNDGKCDPAGRFWAGTMALDASPDQGALYMLDADCRVHKKYFPVTISNGLCWSKNAERMHYIDTPTHRVLQFDFDITQGEIQNPRTLVAIDKEDGNPDGMTIDENDRLWIALWGGSAVVCYDPKKKAFVEKIKLPTAHVSSCAFGGLDLSELYITTAREGLTAMQLTEQPLAGALFKIPLDVRGTPTFSFNG